MEMLYFQIHLGNDEYLFWLQLTRIHVGSKLCISPREDEYTIVPAVINSGQNSL